MTKPVSVLHTYVRVRFQECDPLGHVNNAVYITYLEQAAIDHAALANWPANRLLHECGAVFVAHRHEIQFHHSARENDVLEIITWPERASGARVTRRYRVYRVDQDPYTIPPASLVTGEDTAVRDLYDLVVEATTDWALIDTNRNRPVRIPPNLIHDFLREDLP